MNTEITRGDSIPDVSQEPLAALGSLEAEYGGAFDVSVNARSGGLNVYGFHTIKPSSPERIEELRGKLREIGFEVAANTAKWNAPLEVAR